MFSTIYFTLIHTYRILEIVTTDTKEIYKCPCVKFLSVFSSSFLFTFRRVARRTQVRRCFHIVLQKKKNNNDNNEKRKGKKMREKERAF